MKDLVAEFSGTFALVFAITASIAGSAALAGGFGVGNVLVVALTAGLVLVALIYAYGSVSGAHFNPAVTLGLWAADRFPAKKVPAYLAAQFLGGLVAAGLLAFIAGNTNVGPTGVGGFGETAAILMELIATGLFVSVILFVSDEKNGVGNHAPLAIGFFLAVAHLFGIPFSGASLNPARSLGPALVAGGAALQQVWIYLVAPALAAIVVGFKHKWFFGR